MLRSILSALVVLSLAVTPVAARTVPSAKAEPAAAAKTAMPDCHRMMQGTAEKPAPADPASKSCPDCDKSTSCAADACQLKCFKVFGAILGEGRKASGAVAQFDVPTPPHAEPWNRQPGTPPPRA